ncbi:hypothetical protein [Streptomyces sp. NPDC085529]|uniref:hypothetical protein n=1 Tax=Streptomyces sp. NPDC085529 TaxID=3365729 RepID=UPI0037D54488
MSREDRWILFSSWLSLTVWVALGWVLLDADLQGLQETLGWWMIAIAVAPLLIGAGGMSAFEEPRTGERVAWADEDPPKLNGRGLESCGGCGG